MPEALTAGARLSLLTHARLVQEFEILLDADPLVQFRMVHRLVLANGGDHLDEEERAALHKELELSLAEAKAGKLIAR